MVHCYKINVRGKVQGVGYRFNTQAMAHKLNLTGFVKNLPDESVLILVEGEEENINQLIEWCYTGPRYSEVLEVKAEEEELKGFTNFEIKR